MRESRDRGRSRPAVSQDRTAAPRRGDWRTLREASELTGIPIGTLRKWCRRNTVDSYLESDGELTLRMVEMGSVRAKGATRRSTPDASRTPEEMDRETRDTRHETPPRTAGPDTMIVPVDAWNKMLNQLGNLHEAGQQLAEARERAAKAETEAQFLRERLAELRQTTGSSPSAEIPPPGGEASPTKPMTEGLEPRTQPSPGPTPPLQDGREDQSPTDASVETAPFWRYVWRGWRGRRK